MTTLLIDADGTAFTAAAAVQKTHWWDDDIASTHADFNEAKDAFQAQIDSYTAVIDDDAEIILCFSCPTRRYFRHGLLDTYKANRKGQPPLLLGALKEWASVKFETKTKPGLEADDVLGILATHPKLVPGRKIIVTVDKDLQQIPGYHLNARAPSEGEFKVSPEYAERWLWYQALVGDSTDNYSGCPGIGPVKADKILAGISGEAQFVAACIEAYRKAGLDEAAMEIQVNIARILQHDTYNFKTKEPILWKLNDKTQEKPASISSPRNSKKKSPKS